MHTNDISERDLRRINTVEAALDDNEVFYQKQKTGWRLWYWTSGTLQVLLAALIPVVSLLPKQIPGTFTANWFQTFGPVVVALAGLTIAILRGAEGLFQARENWIRSASTLQRLRAERVLFRANAGPYKTSSDPIALYAENVENIVLGESAAWQLLVGSQSKGMGADTPS